MPEIQMPKLSDTMTEGTLGSWKKKVGDKVSSGEVLAEIETDKATMEWEATDDGILQEIYVGAGGKVNVGDRIAFIGEKGEKAPAGGAEAEEEKKAETEKPDPAEAKQPETAPAPQKAPTKKAAAKKAEPEAEERPETGRVKASPLARKIAAEKEIDLTNIKGTGP